MSTKQQTPGVCASVITYHPEPECLAHIVSVAAQVERMLVVDNCSGEPTRVKLKALADEHGIELILNDENVGVAAGLNQAVQWADERGFDWLLTLDQDSILFEGAAERLLCVGKEAQEAGRIAVVGCNYVNKFSGDLHLDADGVVGSFVDTITVITSGSLMFIPAAREIGPFRSDYFIDHVDDEYCLRARAKGFAIALTREPLMQHVICSPIKRRFLWKRLVSPNAPPFRRYYQARNHLVMARQYCHAEPEWVKWSLRIRLKEFLLILMIENQKCHKMFAILRGLIDGLLGRMGPLGNKKANGRGDCQR